MTLVPGTRLGPMIDRARFKLFKEVRIDTGTHEGSDLR